MTLLFPSINQTIGFNVTQCDGEKMIHIAVTS